MQIPSPKMNVTINLNHHPRAIVNNCLLAPATLFEMLGFAVVWSPPSTIVSIIKHTYLVTAIIDSPTLVNNGKLVIPDAPAQIIDGRLLLPVRAILESTGHQVIWDRETNRMVVRAG